VSCPHYLGEVVIYAGLVAALAGRRTTAWLMLLWVVSAVQCSACPLRRTMHGAGAHMLHQGASWVRHGVSLPLASPC
jgi:hypothetical protein